MNTQQYVERESAKLQVALTRKLLTVEDARSALEGARSAGYSNDSDEIKERNKALKSAHARVDECETLIRVLRSAEVVSLCFAHKIDFGALVSESQDSREAKKRFGIVMTAIALRNPEKLGMSEFTYFGALASGKLAPRHTIEEARLNMLKKDSTTGRLIPHDGTTQPGYMRTFLNVFGISRERKGEIDIDVNNAIYKKIIALFN